MMVYNQMPFVKDNDISQEDAATIIAERNPTWFKSPCEVVNVVAHTVTAGTNKRKMLEIFTTTAVMKRFNSQLKKLKRVDVVAARLLVFKSVKVDQCFNCWRIGHMSRQCEHPKRCRYCVIEHETVCPNRENPEKHECYLCIERKKGNVSTKSANHSASSARCPLVRARRKQLRTEGQGNDHRENKQ